MTLKFGSYGQILCPATIHTGVTMVWDEVTRACLLMLAIVAPLMLAGLWVIGFLVAG